MTPDFFMGEALTEADKAYAMGEVPVGAVIEKDGEIIGRGHNCTETLKDPTAHAEMNAIKQAVSVLGNWRLTECKMYVTAEPCPMCAGAIVLARIDKIFIGTKDPKTGACGSLMNIPQDTRLNHFSEIEIGVLEQQCRDMMKEFFKSLRHKKKIQKQINQEENQ